MPVSALTRPLARAVAAGAVLALAPGLMPQALAAPPPASVSTSTTITSGSGSGSAPSAALADLVSTEQPVAPGAELASYQSQDPAEPLSAQALTLDLTSDVKVDYLATDDVADAATVSDMTAEHDAGEDRTAVAALNGDFFDINATSAPLGNGVSDGELRQSSSEGYTQAVGIGPDSAGRILDLYFEGTLTLPGGETAELDSYNAASVPEDGIGMYTSQWGEADRAEPVSGASAVTEVTVEDGEVTSVSEKPGADRVADGSFVLLGRGAGARTLAALAAGDTVDVAYDLRTSGGGDVPRTVVGGRDVLVQDGEAQDWEGESNNEAAPRTAVGFSRDGQEMYILTVDGRQASSAGVTLTELATMMADLGAYNALNLDGGGSTTLLAREAGESDPELINSPSDGQEREVPNGLVVTAPEGSGKLAGFRVTTATDAESAPAAAGDTAGHPERVFPGLTRRLTATGYDETYGPADRDQHPRWSTGSRRVGTVSHDGVFSARATGTTAVTASKHGARGSITLTVLGELDRMEPTTQHVALTDATDQGSFGFTGYDAEGTSAPIEPADIELAYDTSLFTIEPDQDSGGFTVTAATDQQPVSGTVTATVGGVTTELVVTVGLADTVVADFSDAADWTFSSARADGTLAAAADGYESTGLRLTYDFSLSTDTRAAYATPPQDIPVNGQPQSFTLWISGDGNGAWPSLQLTGADGTSHVLRGDYVTWEGWREVTFDVPEDVSYPVSVNRFYLAETQADQQYTGEIVIDELTAQTPPAATASTARDGP